MNPRGVHCVALMELKVLEKRTPSLRGEGENDGQQLLLISLVTSSKLEFRGLSAIDIFDFLSMFMLGLVRF